MSSSRPRWGPFFFTALAVFFLWLPPLCLYGGALWRVLSGQPERLLEAVPLRPLQRFLFGNTVQLCALTGVLAVLCGVPVGVAMARGPRAWRGVFLTACALPLALPPMLMAGAWLEWTRTPPARALASLAATRASTIPPIALAAPILALCFFPVVAFATRGALLNIPSGAEDAARLMGGAWQTWRRVLGPLLWPAVAAAAGIVAAMAMWEMGAPDLVDARTYSVEIYRNLNAPDELDPQGKAVKAALAGVPLLLLGALALWPAARALRGGVRLTSPEASPETSREAAALCGEGHIAALLAALVLLASPCAPLLVFALQLRPLRVLWETWQSNDREIINTIVLATAGALLITGVAFALVVCWRGWPARARHVALWLCVAPMLVPPVMSGIALLGFWNRPPIKFAELEWIFVFVSGSPPPTWWTALESVLETPLNWMFDFVSGSPPPTDWTGLDAALETASRYALMLIGYAARFGPLAILLLDEASRRVDASLLEAAQNLGATGSRATRTVLAPALAPALTGTFALLWALCAGELSTSVLINQPGGQTLPVPIFNLMHIGSTAEVAALSLCLFALSGGALLAAVAVNKPCAPATKTDERKPEHWNTPMTLNWNTLDEQWRNRHDAAQFEALETALDKALYNQGDKPDYAILWRWARMSHFRAMQSLGDGNEQASEKASKDAARRHFAAGAQEAQQAVRLQPNRVEGHFWFGASIISKRRAPAARCWRRAR